MHVEAKGKPIMGSEKKVLQISQKNDTTQKAAEVENSMSSENNR